MTSGETMARGFRERDSTSSFSWHCLGDADGVEAMVSRFTSTTEQCTRKMGRDRVKNRRSRSPIFIVVGTGQTVEMEPSISGNTGCDFEVASVACQVESEASLGNYGASNPFVV